MKKFKNFNDGKQNSSEIEKKSRLFNLAKTPCKLACLKKNFFVEK